MSRPTSVRCRLAWFALRVRAGWEKCIGQALQAKSLEVFVPAFQVRHRWCDRWKWIEQPLFPGYLFTHSTPADRVSILSTPGVLQIVGNGKKPVPVEDGEIEAIRELLASEQPVSPWPFCRVGDRIRIASGPLRGIEGILLSIGERRKLVVSVSLLQRSVAVEIDPNWAVPKMVSPGARALADYATPDMRLL